MITTLILIDEFGTGTDPEVGGAIAESVLAHINKKEVGVWSLLIILFWSYMLTITKVMNGSMLFDSNGLKPTYIFQSGKSRKFICIWVGKN